MRGGGLPCPTVARAELPTISIITPCLNAATTLPEALASVRSQGYPKVEHIVVDGGSTDGTVEILEAEEGVSFISEPDRGLSHAVNKGIARATGEVIGWLNADDYYQPGTLLAVGEALAARPDAMWVTGRCPIVDADGGEIRRPVTAYKNFLLRRWSFPLYLTQNFISCPATFLRRAVLEEVGPMSERYTSSGDYDLFLRVARQHRPIVLEADLAVFRMVDGSISMSGFERQFREHAENARQNGRGHPFAVALNAFVSRLIVLAYRGLRLLRRSRPGLTTGRSAPPL